MLARAPPAPPAPRGRHKGPSLGRWSRPSAPQAVAGSLANRQKRAETGDVRAERRGWVGMGPEAAWGVLGMHVGRGNGADGHAQVGLLVRLTLVVLNSIHAKVRPNVRAEVPGTTRLGAPTRLASLGRHNGAVAARWSGSPHGAALGAPVRGAKMPVEPVEELVYDSARIHVNTRRSSPESTRVRRKAAAGRRDCGWPGVWVI